MIGIDQIVWFVFMTIIVIGILALLWWLIGYCESKLPMPMAWNIVRVVFVIMCVFLLIAILLGLLGHPLVRFGDERRVGIGAPMIFAIRLVAGL